MKTISRYIMTLALLITAVGGAWADETPLLTIESTGYTSFRNGSKTFDEKVTITFSDWAYNDGDEYGWYSSGAAGSLLTVAGTNGYTITSCKFYTENGTAVTGYTIAGESPSVFLSDNNVYTDANKSVSIGSQGVKKIEVFGAAASAATEPTIDVTTNAASEQDLFTTASFNMPAFDATAEYELVRDMSIQMTATMGDGTDGVRYRVKKAQQGQGYEPADLDMTQVLGLVAVNDGIEQKALTLEQDYYCRIYKLDEQTLQPEGDGVKLNDFDFAPGLYALKAFAQDGSDYAGETALSNTFQLFQGYEVTIPAGEYITYYSDEPLRVENGSGAQIYTISAVDETTATLMGPMDAMKANKPMLIYNNTDAENTFLLIPCNEPDVLLSVAKEFVGTTTATSIPASTSSESNYAFNGKDFVWVKNEIAIGANKCWISITKASSVRSITLVNNSPTAIGATLVNSEEVNSEEWFDLNGRKVNKPTKKGIYIKNGQKVVIK